MEEEAPPAGKRRSGPQALRCHQARPGLGEGTGALPGELTSGAGAVDKAGEGPLRSPRGTVAESGLREPGPPRSGPCPPELLRGWGPSESDTPRLGTTPGLRRASGGRGRWWRRRDAGCGEEAQAPSVSPPPSCPRDSSAGAGRGGGAYRGPRVPAAACWAGHDHSRVESSLAAGADVVAGIGPVLVGSCLAVSAGRARRSPGPRKSPRWVPPRPPQAAGSARGLGSPRAGPSLWASPGPGGRSSRWPRTGPPAGLAGSASSRFAGTRSRGGRSSTPAAQDQALVRLPSAPRRRSHAGPDLRGGGRGGPCGKATVDRHTDTRAPHAPPKRRPALPFPNRAEMRLAGRASRGAGGRPDLWGTAAGGRRAGGRGQRGPPPPAVPVGPAGRAAAGGGSQGRGASSPSGDVCPGASPARYYSSSPSDARPRNSPLPEESHDRGLSTPEGRLFPARGRLFPARGRPVWSAGRACASGRAQPPQAPPPCRGALSQPEAGLAPPPRRPGPAPRADRCARRPMGCGGPATATNGVPPARGPMGAGEPPPRPRRRRVESGRGAGPGQSAGLGRRGWPRAALCCRRGMA